MKGRKMSGGRYHKQRKKKLYEMPGNQRVVKLGKEKKKTIRTRGGSIKTVLLSTSIANVFNPKTKKCRKTRIKNVIETPADKFLARTNVLIKGAVIETELGKAKITNRPSQEASLNAVLIED